MKRKIIYVLLVAGLLLSVALSLSFGAMHIPLRDVLLAFAHRLGLWKDMPLDETYAGVISVLRLPRTLLGMLVGAALGISGAAIQGIFRNPLAEPGLIGISAGASLMAAAIIVLEPMLFAGLSALLGYYLLALGAFAGAGFAAFFVYQIAKKDGHPQVSTMLLAGIAINALAGAFTAIISYLSSEQQLRSITFWMLGSLGGANWEMVWSLLPFAGLAIAFLPSQARPLNAFALGESQADQIGMRSGRVKTRVVVLATLAVGASVAVSGIISFVGLLVPHIVRLLGGPDHKFVLPASALMGAFILTAADLLARLITAPIELPIGVITALLGTPVFLYILIKDKKKLLQ